MGITKVPTDFSGLVPHQVWLLVLVPGGGVLTELWFENLCVAAAAICTQALAVPTCWPSPEVWFSLTLHSGIEIRTKPLQSLMERCVKE